MAGTKIEDLTATTALASGDMLPVALAAGGNRLITKADLKDTLDAEAPMDSALTMTSAAAAGAVVTRVGGSVTEGWERYVMEETINLAGAGADFVEMTNAIPANSIIRVVQVNLETACTGDGDTAAIGIGIGAGTSPIKYGETTDLTKNQKIDTFAAQLLIDEDVPVDGVVLAAADKLEVCGTNGSGSGASDNLTGGTVRVRVVYETLNSLDDAA